LVKYDWNIAALPLANTRHYSERRSATEEDSYQETHGKEIQRKKYTPGFGYFGIVSKLEETWRTCDRR